MASRNCRLCETWRGVCHLSTGYSCTHLPTAFQATAQAESTRQRVVQDCEELVAQNMVEVQRERAKASRERKLKEEARKRMT